ncbi:MAG: alpha/beta hydrolase [Verrucomicrobiaceae bacterium]|nr:alpha/beta hydrolase [Verrucomicrobiaceae bacterium]
MQHTVLNLPGSGLSLRADAYGDEHAHPVIFLHGTAQSRRAWIAAAKKVAESGYRGITVDLRGHGDSEWSAAGDYDVEAFTRDVECLLAWARQPVTLVGASRGGQAAFIAASRFPQQVRLVVLADVVPRSERSGISHIYTFLNQSLDGFADVDEAADALAVLSNQPRAQDASGLRKVMREGANGRWFWQWDPACARPEFMAPPAEILLMEEAARQMRCPTVLVRGTHSDLVTLESVQQFKALLPDLMVVEAVGQGHMFTGDVNDTFATSLHDYLERFSKL